MCKGPVSLEGREWGRRGRWGQGPEAQGCISGASGGSSSAGQTTCVQFSEKSMAFDPSFKEFQKVKNHRAGPTPSFCSEETELERERHLPEAPHSGPRAEPLLPVARPRVFFHSRPAALLLAGECQQQQNANPP